LEPIYQRYKAVGGVAYRAIGFVLPAILWGYSWQVQFLEN
jgi:hypothetical protein